MAPASWVRGNKFVYIDRHRPEFEAAPESERPYVYRAVARGLMCLAGDAPFEFNFRTHDIDDGEPEPSQADHDKLTDTSGLSADECKRRKDIIHKLGQDISQYYRRKDHQLNRPSPIDFTRIALALAGKFRVNVTNRPSQYYSCLCYAERIKAKFEERFAAETKAWEAEKESAERTGASFTKKCPTDVGVRTIVTNECWAQESPEFRAMVEKLHAEEVEKQRQEARDLVGMNIPSTAEELQRLYDRAGLLLQPYSDAFAAAFKGVVAIMICAPMPEDGGNLGVVSIHSGMSRGFVQTKWPHGICKDGFRRVEQELLEFGEHVFSQEDKEAAAFLSASKTTTSSASTSEPQEQPSSEPQDQPEDRHTPSTNDTMNNAQHDINDKTHAPHDSAATHHEEMHENIMPETNDKDALHDNDVHETNNEDLHDDDAHETNNEDLHDNDAHELDGDGIHDVDHQHHLPNGMPSTPAPRPSTPAAPQPLFLHDSSPVGHSRAGSAAQSPDRTFHSHQTLRDDTSRPPSVRASSEPPPSPDVEEPLSQPTLDIPPSQPALSLARQRTTRTASAPSTLGSGSSSSAATHGVWKMAPAPTWSEHVRSTLDACRRCGLSWAAAFGDVVQSYIKFEEVHGFPVKDAGRKIISKKEIRPPQYSLWTKTARPYDRSMPIPNADEFAQQWWRWLAAHLPETHRVPGSYLLDLSRADMTDSATWNGLDKACGKDGMLQFVLALLWWGNAVHGPNVQNATRRDNWEAACIELSGMLKAMTTSTVKTVNKRKSSETGEGSSRKRPRQLSRAVVAASATTPTTARPRRR